MDLKNLKDTADNFESAVSTLEHGMELTKELT